jgi:transposase
VSSAAKTGGIREVSAEDKKTNFFTGSELNPIEYSWSKIKNFLRKRVARTKEHLYQALSEALKIITIQDVHAYFIYCGLCVLHNQ